MQNIAFDPKAVTVKVGQKVTWTNDDSTDHNVTSQSGETIKSDNFGKGGTFSFTPTKAGTINYVCTIHPGMTATRRLTRRSRRGRAAGRWRAQRRSRAA